MTRNTTLDFIKGILITLVCIGHATQYLSYQNGNGFWDNPLFKAIYMFHMPLFMAVSGYLSYRGITSAPSIPRYIVHRLSTYLLPIFIWAIIYQCTLFLIGLANLINTLPVDAMPLDKLPFTIITEGFSSFWFLWALLASLVLVALAQMAGRYRGAVLTLFFIGVFFSDSGGRFYFANLYLFQFTLPFFIAGFYAATWDLSRIPARHWPLATGAFAVGSVLCFVYWNKETYIYWTLMDLAVTNLPNIALRWIGGGIVSIFALLVLVYAKPYFPQRLEKLFVRAGQDSILIYILQQYAFGILGSLAMRYFAPASSVFVADMLGLMLGMLVTYLSWQLGYILSLEKHLARMLFGKTSKPNITSAVVITA